MICHPYRCVFIHIPKTAGISIEHVFLRLVGLTWESRAPLLLRGNDDPAKGPPRLAHLRASEYVALGHLRPEEFNSYFKFSFVRNPWDRIVSEYKYRGHPLRMDFKTWLSRHLPKPGFTDAYNHIVPQYDFLYDDRGTLLADFVGRYERLQADFEVVCARLGIPPTPLPYENRSLEGQPGIGRLAVARRWVRQRVFWYRKRRHVFPHYTQYYDDESREFVGRLYRQDIEAFGYSFGDERAATAPSSDPRSE